MNHPRAWRAFLNLAAMGFAALMLSCGGGGGGGTPAPPPAPVATSLTTSDANPAFGATFTLTPVYSAGTGTLSNGVTCPATGVATAPITANWTTGARSYTLTVTNSAGATATKSVTVTPQTVAVGAISPAAVTRTVGTTTTFTATVTGGALNTVNWSSGGVGTWAGNVWTAPNTAGSVTITATSADDSTKTATTTVTVEAVPQPVATSLVASTQTPAFGATFTLTPTYTNGAGAIDNGVTCPATGVAVNVTADWAGTRTFTLTVTNGVESAITRVDVTPMVVNVGSVSPAAPTKTVNSATTFSATATGGALNTVRWSASAGSFVGNVWTAPSAAGSVTITATSNDDSTKTATTTVTVVSVPVASSLAASTQTPAFGATFTLTPTYSGGTGAIDNGVTCPATTVASAPITANWSGARTYTLTVTNAANVTATEFVVVTPQVVAVGAISPATPTKTVNSTTTFATTVTGGALNTVDWSASGGSFVGDVWTAPATAGSVTITATSKDDSSKTATTTVTVVGLAEIASFTAAKGTITNGNGTSLSYSFTGSDGFIDPGHIAVTTGGTTNVSPTVDTTYTLTVRNAAGDPVTATVPITVVPAASITAFTANGSAISTTVTTGSTVTLHAEYADGNGTLSHGLGSISIGGDVVTAPLTATTTFTLTVTNAALDAVTRDVTVNVVAPGAFTFAGNMTGPRNAPTATLLGDNSVLIVGGSSGGSLASAEIYSGGTTYTATTSPMGIGRQSHSATRLADGRVLITGGFDSVSGQVLATAEIYDPGTKTFTPTGNMATARQDHTATLLPNGLVLIAGGTDGSAIKGAELFDPTGNANVGTFAALIGPNAWPAPRTRATHTATLLADGTVLLAGGYNGSVYGTADIYDPVSNTFTPAGDMGLIRWGHTATLLSGGKVLFTGGRNGPETTGAVLAAAELYDPAAKTFSAVVAPMISAREWHAVSLLADGKVLIVGGDRDVNVPGGPLDYLASAEVYDPASGLFTATASMVSTRVNATATLVPTGPGTGFVLIAGGGGVAGATESFQ